MKLRYFYKIDHKREPILGSNVRRKSKPEGHQWKEIIDPCCTTPDAIPCICGPRFFVQLDGKGKPVDGTLIKREKYPAMTEGIRYMEIVNSVNECCALITWEVEGIGLNGFGNTKIYDNGLLVVDKDVVAGDDVIGSFRPSKSDATIQVIVTLDGDHSNTNVLNITGGTTHTLQQYVY